MTTKRIMITAAALLIGSVAFASNVKAPSVKTKATSEVLPDFKPTRKEPPIRAGAAIVVKKYDGRTRTLSVNLIAEPAVGPNITTPEALITAIQVDDEGDRKQFLENPVRFVGGEYTLRANLELIPQETVKNGVRLEDRHR